MNRKTASRIATMAIWYIVGLGCAIGCMHTASDLSPTPDVWRAVLPGASEYDSTSVERVGSEELLATPSPRHVQSLERIEYWPMTLEDCVRISLQHSQVLRDLGGRIITQSGATNSRWNPAINVSDPRAGVDAALSAFDTQLNGSLLWRRNNRGLKLPPPGVTNTEIHQYTQQSRLAASRQLRTGTRVEFQQGLDYDRDDFGVPPNRFSSIYQPFMGVEVRHPLARGAGRQVNEIAGPNAAPGVYNGVRIAMVRAEIAETDFQIALRDYLFNVTRNYWLLQLAYARLDAQRKILDAARQTHQAAEQKYASGLIEQDAVNAAIERVLTAELAYENALAGGPERQLTGILGTNGGFLSGTELGVLALERRLRFLMGLPASDGRLIQPIDLPIAAPLHFDWGDSLSIALERRPELARQDKVVQQRQLEWVAARNQLLPTVDLIGQYRLLGFGDNLFGNRYVSQDGAVDELLVGEQQEWAAGMEVKWPIANRIGRTAERNAMIQLTREKEILRQQQLQVSHELSSAVNELKRAESALRLSERRQQVAHQRKIAAESKFADGVPIPVESVFSAQASEAEAALTTSLSAVDYAIAMTAFNVARGTIMQELCVEVASNLETGSNTVDPTEPTTKSALLLDPTAANRR